MIFCRPPYRVSRAFSEKACTGSSGEQEPARTVISNEQRAEVLVAALRRRVPADNEFLLADQFDFQPGGVAPAGFVERIRSFRDQALQLKLLHRSEKLVFIAAQLFRELDVFRSFLEQLGQQFTALNERPVAQVCTVQEEQIESVVNERVLWVFANPCSSCPWVVPEKLPARFNDGLRSSATII